MMEFIKAMENLLKNLNHSTEKTIANTGSIFITFP